MIFNMWSKDLEIRAKKSSDLYFKTEGVVIGKNTCTTLSLLFSSFCLLGHL